jgi:hypothetical protein
MQGLVPIPLGSRLPYELAPGKRWTALMDQRDLEKKIQSDGILYVGVYHSASKTAALVRVRLEP